MQVLMEQKIGNIHADRRNACAARKGNDPTEAPVIEEQSGMKESGELGGGV